MNCGVLGYSVSKVLWAGCAAYELYISPGEIVQENNAA